MAENNPHKFDFTGEEHRVKQGAYFERSFTMNQATVDFITGKSIVCEWRKSSGATEVIKRFTLADNTIVISGLTFTYKANADDMDVAPGDFVYDTIAYTNADDRAPIQYGIGLIKPKVTRI